MIWYENILVVLSRTCIGLLFLWVPGCCPIYAYTFCWLDFACSGVDDRKRVGLLIAPQQNPRLWCYGLALPCYLQEMWIRFLSGETCFMEHLHLFAGVLYPTPPGLSVTGRVRAAGLWCHLQLFHCHRMWAVISSPIFLLELYIYINIYTIPKCYSFRHYDFLCTDIWSGVILLFFSLAFKRICFCCFSNWLYINLILWSDYA